MNCFEELYEWLNVETIKVLAIFWFIEKECELNLFKHFENKNFKYKFSVITGSAFSVFIINEIASLRKRLIKCDERTSNNLKLISKNLFFA